MDALSIRLRTKFIQMGLRMIVLLQMTSYLWPKDTPLADIQICYDFIIVGCGTAGSILANRLTASGDFKVLVIEAGMDAPMESLYPGSYSYLQNSQYDWNFTSINDGFTAQVHRNHILQLTSGKVLGGSSSLGHLLYIRGDPNDYNHWAKITKDKSWTYENLLPYFKKSENLCVDRHIHTHSPKRHMSHGYDGLMGVTRNTNPFNQKYLHVFKQAGHHFLHDVNGNKTLGYFEPMLMLKDGIRQSMPYTFLTPIKKRPNLHILKGAEVIEIMIIDKKAVGVKIVKNGKMINIKAKREVILSAGAIKTPQLLLLSGVGPQDDIKGYGIDAKADLPVGKNYQDHLHVTLVHKLNVVNHKSTPADPHEYPSPIVMLNAAVDKSKTCPEYQAINYVIPSDSDKLLSMCSVESSFVDEVCESLYNKTTGHETLLSKIVLLHPKSRGHVVLQSKDYKDPPIIITGSYSRDDDIDNMISYILDFLHISKTAYFKRFGGKLVHPKLKECENYPGVSYWKCYVLNMMGSANHYVGTCSMGRVVDGRLRVFGIDGLRVIDASVIPLIPSGHTQAAVMMIAEKGADMILEDARKANLARC